MVNIGFDTVKFHKAFDPQVVRERIEPYIGYGRNKTMWFKGFMIFRNPRNCNSFSFQNSFAKYASDRGNNLLPATMDMMGEAIVRFEEESDLSIRDAYVSRLDVTMNLETEHAARDYRKLMREYNGYRFPEKEKQQENTGYMQSSEKSLVMYDKKREMLEKGREDDRLDSVENLLRVEWQMKRHVEKGLGIGKNMAPLTLGLLSEGYGYASAVRSLENNCIKLLGLDKGEREERKTRQAIEHEAMKRIAIMHHYDMEKALQDVMQENNVGKDVYDCVMAGHEKKKTRSMGEELYYGLRKGCDDVYGGLGMQRETLGDDLMEASESIMEKLEQGFIERTS